VETTLRKRSIATARDNGIEALEELARRGLVTLMMLLEPLLTVRLKVIQGVLRRLHLGLLLGRLKILSI